MTPRSVNNFLATVVLIAAVVLMFAGENSVVEADEFPAFFLKAAKSVPRIGRRSGTFEDYFLKASKSIPRIGRRGGYAPSSVKSAENNWSWYPKHPTDLSKIGSEDFSSSENYERAMQQQSPELWEIISAGATPDSPSAAGFNDDLWQREKRTGSERAEV
ncbi:uncharacterized protein LOC105683663 [Athalia rosae]|uniref:uncharacterized protein LOC105683663 n=1 Tax=Athalia rosae TaxID=37344 RepID=UPI0020343038|nr:uncharacterized protein LOC105683663 [Athalia rosae]